MIPYLFSFSGGTFLRGVQGNPNFFPILVQGDAVYTVVLQYDISLYPVY